MKAVKLCKSFNPKDFMVQLFLKLFINIEHLTNIIFNKFYLSSQKLIIFDFLCQMKAKMFADGSNF